MESRTLPLNCKISPHIIECIYQIIVFMIAIQAPMHCIQSSKSCLSEYINIFNVSETKKYSRIGRSVSLMARKPKSKLVSPSSLQTQEFGRRFHTPIATLYLQQSCLSTTAHFSAQLSPDELFCLNFLPTLPSRIEGRRAAKPRRTTTQYTQYQKNLRKII